MLTLDTLARMADRMPTEMNGASGAAPFRLPDAETRLREVTLPSVADETRRAAGLFVFVLGVGVLCLSSAGVIVSHAADALAGHALDSTRLLDTALWYAGWTAACLGPLAAIGLVREVRRFIRVRRMLGPSVLLDARGCLHSARGSVQLRPS